MKFTNYYSSLIKANGVPQLNVKQHAKLMNIIVIEAGMKHLEQLKCEGQSQTNKNQTLFNLKHKLRDLTHNQPPEILMKMMVEASW